MLRIWLRPPDVILASGTLAVTALQHISRAVSIVFAAVADPVGAGIVDSLAHPGGNATGFMIYEYNLAAKYLEPLKEIAPRVTRVAIIRNAGNHLFGKISATLLPFESGGLLKPLIVVGRKIGADGVPSRPILFSIPRNSKSL